MNNIYLNLNRAFRIQPLSNKNILYNQTAKRLSSDELLHFGDIQSRHVVRPRVTTFVNSYCRTRARSDKLKQLFSIDLHDNKLFCYDDIVTFGNLFHHDNSLPIEVRVNESSILRDRLKHKIKDKKITMNKKELFLYGLNALKLAYMDIRGTQNFLDMTKSLESLESEYKVNIQHLILQRIYSVVQELPENIILFTYRKHMLELHDLKVFKQYKDMELVIALYGYISIIGDKRKFEQVSNCVLQKIKI